MGPTRSRMVSGHSALSMLLSMVIAAGCTPQPVRTEVLPARADSPAGVLAVTVTETAGSCRGERDACAIGAALEQLLFRGVPGSTQPQPLIADERAARQQHAAFIDDLLKGAAGRKYVTQADRTSSNPPRHVVSVNVTLLRNALVQQGVIRRFGY
jgi:hypothetical protein